MASLLMLLGLVITLVQTIRSGVSEVTEIVSQISGLFQALNPIQRLAVAQLVDAGGDPAERAALEWIMNHGHGPTDTDEARDLAGVVLAARGDSLPES